ncbi:MAG: AbrB/MazE/SpoVT family DNA-binding domain-containing protein [Verrucomicrobiae bacterium]|nr:AbrB/MazE/SpoVT family DNA-binding domain-containing protein [Verrucomicrobiae bacterium]
MDTVTLSPKFQIVIPRAIRESLRLKAGQKLQIINFDGQIVVVPLRPIKEMRGAFKGMNTNFERESDRL